MLLLDVTLLLSVTTTTTHQSSVAGGFITDSTGLLSSCREVVVVTNQLLQPPVVGTIVRHELVTMLSDDNCAWDMFLEVGTFLSIIGEGDFSTDNAGDGAFALVKLLSVDFSTDDWSRREYSELLSVDNTDSDSTLLKLLSAEVEGRVFITVSRRSAKCFITSPRLLIWVMTGPKNLTNEKTATVSFSAGVEASFHSGSSCRRFLFLLDLRLLESEGSTSELEKTTGTARDFQPALSSSRLS